MTRDAVDVNDDDAGASWGDSVEDYDGYAPPSARTRVTWFQGMRPRSDVDGWVVVDGPAGAAWQRPGCSPSAGEETVTNPAAYPSRTTPKSRYAGPEEETLWTSSGPPTSSPVEEFILLILGCAAAATLLGRPACSGQRGGLARRASGSGRRRQNHPVVAVPGCAGAGLDGPRLAITAATMLALLAWLVSAVCRWLAARRRPQ